MMTDPNNFTSNPGAGLAAAETARTRLREEQHAAGHEFQKGHEALRDQASALARDAKEEVRERGESLKGQAADGLKTFADAVRSAREELAKKDMGPISGLVDQAAEGLETLSRGLQDKSASEMLDTVRDFGRRNPVGFIAATVLAGIAIGRFAGSSAHHERKGAGAPARSRSAPGGYPPGEAAVTPTRTGDIT